MTPTQRVVDPHLQYPFLAGVYLAINAVGGARIVVDGPMCAFYKAEYIQGNHQLVADLQRHASTHRVLHTELDIQRAVMGDEALFHEKIRQAAADPETKVLCFTALSSALLIGRDMERIMDVHRGALPVPLVSVPSRALSGDWLDGWGNTLKALAAAVPLPERTPRGAGEPPRVAVVGNLYLRHEGDARGDVRELERLVEALGARLVSCWLSGQNYDDLPEAGRADLLVALPHGEGAADILSERTGIPVAAAPLPFSLDGTAAFLDAVAGALGGDAPARGRAFLEAERARWAPELLYRSEQVLLGTTWLVADDPWRLAGWEALAGDLGIEIVAACPTARPRGDAFADGPEPIPLPELRRRIFDQAADGIVASGPHMDQIIGPVRPWARVEWGYPCFRWHPVVPTPTYGLVGETVLAERLCEALHAARRGPPSPPVQAPI